MTRRHLSRTIRAAALLAAVAIAGLSNAGQAQAASHALIHTAEGELFRKALVNASERYGLPVTGVKERELFDRGTVDLHIPVDKLKRHVAELGRAIGPPWRQDEKLAALAGWVALAAASKR